MEDSARINTSTRTKEWCILQPSKNNRECKVIYKSLSMESDRSRRRLADYQ